MSESGLSLVRPRVAAGVLFLHGEGRALMVVPSYKDHLDIPGGMVEPGESPKAAARREVDEELGIRPPVGRLLVADWWVDSTDGQGGAKLLFVFDGGQLEHHHHERITVDGAEIVAFRFCAPADLATVTTTRLANRIAHAITARTDGTTSYLEDGQPVTGPGTRGPRTSRKAEPTGLRLYVIPYGPGAV